jgi:hypothetical protein
MMIDLLALIILGVPIELAVWLVAPELARVLRASDRTCPQCGHESRLNYHEIVERADVLECGNPNCGDMFAPDETN